MINSLESILHTIFKAFLKHKNIIQSKMDILLYRKTSNYAPGIFTQTHETQFSESN